ncbi:MAG TPA: PfkB family carbohydrate kinase [Ktedonobacteraceae bacterium]|nr:PfkB family carbohydrate kinase [Ktedonobacteraceae bacterium]
MSSILQPINKGTAPDFLTIGHVTRDILPDQTFSLGGTVSFAALTAYHLGLVVAITTCADAELLAELPARLPEIGLAVHTSSATTAFINTYHEGFRTQYLRARADQLQLEDVPEAWHKASVVLFGPLDQELSPSLVSLFPRHPGSIFAATPQGWLRRWDENGRVWPTPWAAAGEILPLLDVLILSHEDLLPFANGNRTDADAMLSHWSMQVPLLVATDGRHGATLFQHGIAERFPAYPAHEIDPTGAGDVFAAAFLVYYHRHGDPRKAVDFANCVASLSIEQVGIAGIPTMEMVRERIPQSS